MAAAFLLTAVCTAGSVGRPVTGVPGLTACLAEGAEAPVLDAVLGAVAAFAAGTARPLEVEAVAGFPLGMVVLLDFLLLKENCPIRSQTPAFYTVKSETFGTGFRCFFFCEGIREGRRSEKIGQKGVGILLRATEEAPNWISFPFFSSIF